MVINDLNIKGVSVTPNEAQPPLIIDPYTMLTRSLSFQLLKMIRGRNPKGIELRSRRNHLKFPCRYALDILREAPRKPALKYLLGLRTLK